MQFHYLDGLKELVKELKGDENIYLGIRPSGFHSGNALTLVVYPILMCQLLSKKRKIKPEFTFYLFLNDWEQDDLEGKDTKAFPFNVYPKNTTLQHIDKINSRNPSIYFWLSFIKSQVRLISKYFPSVKIVPIKNSEMKNSDIMKKHLLKTLSSDKEIGDIFDQHSGFSVKKGNRQYALAVCPECCLSKGKTLVSKKKDLVTHKCKHCKTKTTKHYEDFDYWFYHKPLAIPRLEAFNIDLCITGSDHKKENDYKIRQELISFFGAKVRPFKTLYTPVVMAADKKKMGKSKITPEVL